MGHAYDDGSKQKVSAFVSEALRKGRERFPEKVNLQTKTLRYPRLHWVTATGLAGHWKDSRIDATRVGATGIELTTRNITAFELTPPSKGMKSFPAKVLLKVDGQRLEVAGGSITVGAKAFPGKGKILSFIQPNPANPKKYVVLNSGPTFRENHDKTNSMQNPKLPDWAVIDTATPPDGNAPGRILDADFFDENWQPK